MITVNVNGRLGRDAEVKVSKNGSQFVVFNMATDVYNPQTKENETVWLRVTDGSERTLNNVKYLTKGKLLEVVGELRTSIYNGANGVQISHDVRCFNWSFIATSRSEDGAATTQTETAQPTVTVNTTAPQQQVVPQMAATTGTFVPPTSTHTVPTADDDLPF